MAPPPTPGTVPVTPPGPYEPLGPPGMEPLPEPGATLAVGPMGSPVSPGTPVGLTGAEAVGLIVMVGEE